MALPGQRESFNRRAQTSNNAYGAGLGQTSTSLNGLSGAHRSGMVMGAPDPAMNRRMDGLEQRVKNQDQTNRNLLEQMMKLQQDLKMDMKKLEHGLLEEKGQRVRIQSSLQSSTAKMAEVEDRLKRTEEHARENKLALAQLVSHTKNVERAVTMGQQDIMSKKEKQSEKLQEMHQKLSHMNSNRDSLERMTFDVKDDVTDVVSKVDALKLDVMDLQGAVKLQNKLFESQAKASKESRKESRRDGGEGDGGGKMSETQRGAMEAKIFQLQETIIEVQSNLNHEIKERELDETTLNARLKELSNTIAEVKLRREKDMKSMDSKTRDLAKMSEAEKQAIVVQISAVQTELKQSMDERDQKIRQSVVHRLDEVEQHLKQEIKNRHNHEKDMDSKMDGMDGQMKAYIEQSMDSLRTISTNDQDTFRQRLHDVHEQVKAMELDLAGVKAELGETAATQQAESGAKVGVLEARLEDLSDRLRLGMNKLQEAVGDSRGQGQGQGRGSSARSRGGGDGPDPGAADEAMDAQGLESMREKVAKKIGGLEENITELRNEVRRQDEIIGNRLKMHQQAGEEASTILGDKIQQKMDSVTFSQERMKRQLDDLAGKVQLTPIDMGDLNERLEDVELELAKYSREKEKGGGEDTIEDLKKEVDFIMGRGGESSEISGVPTLSRLRQDIDDVQTNVKTVADGVEKFKEQTDEKFEVEKKERTDELETVTKNLGRQEGRLKTLKEKMKKMKGDTGADDDDDLEEEEGNE